MLCLLQHTAVVGFKGIEMHIDSTRSKTYCCRVKGVTEERSDKQLEAAPPLPRWNLFVQGHCLQRLNIKGIVESKLKFHLLITHHDGDGGSGDIF